MPHRYWIPEEVQTLLDAHDRGIDKSGLSDLFPHRSTEAIAKRYAEVCRERGVRPTPRRSWCTNEEYERLRQYKAQGMLVREISVQMGRSPKAVEHRWHNYLSRPQDPSRIDTAILKLRAAAAAAGTRANLHSRWSASDDEELLSLKSMGLTNGQIAEKLGRSISGVQTRAARLSRRSPA